MQTLILVRTKIRLVPATYRSMSPAVKARTKTKHTYWSRKFRMNHHQTSPQDTTGADAHEAIGSSSTDCKETTQRKKRIGESRWTTQKPFSKGSTASTRLISWSVPCNYSSPKCGSLFKFATTLLGRRRPSSNEAPPTTRTKKPFT